METMSVCLSVCLSVCFCVFLCVCVCLSFCVCLSVCLCLSVCDLVSSAKTQIYEVHLNSLYEIKSECLIWSHIHQFASVCLWPSVCRPLSATNQLVGRLWNSLLEFCKNIVEQASDLTWWHTLNFSHILCILHLKWKKFSKGNIQRHLFSDVSFMEIGLMKGLFHIGAYINFCLYFPHDLSDLGEVHYKRSAYFAVQHLVLQKLDINEIAVTHVWWNHMTFLKSRMSW